ncbi:CHAD domain-containing protein [Propionispira arboris]|uniref:CHAD domain-containing protein n=1 Tax=Propionispira arboris TaxID=84035 RepID=A0A1H7AQE5_9FIRM|nr:CHAD domain-containing protein [Propionispira arboris]SEJ67548.1 CHAD domain-containing protein [Propionispira arboris]
MNKKLAHKLKQKKKTDSLTTLDSFMTEAVHNTLTAQTKYFMLDGSAEGVHDLRIALRKLRAYLSFAALLYSVESQEYWKNILQSWSVRTAEIRELDVLQDEWSKAGSLLNIDSLQDPLNGYLLKHRNNLLALFSESLQTGKLTEDLQAFLFWILNEKTQVKEDSWQSYTDWRLKKWLKNLRQQLKNIDIMDNEAIHRLRIKCKKNRYILEWYSRTRKDQKAARIATVLKQLQDYLGDIHDLEPEVELLNKLGGNAQESELLKEIALLSGWQAKRAYDAFQAFSAQGKDSYCTLVLEK